MKPRQSEITSRTSNGTTASDITSLVKLVMGCLNWPAEILQLRR